jgi:hypothetical protein
MRKLLPSPRNSVPVAAFAGVVARTAAFEVKLGVAVWLGAERASVALVILLEKGVS